MYRYECLESHNFSQYFRKISLSNDNASFKLKCMLRFHELFVNINEFDFYSFQGLVSYIEEWREYILSTIFHGSNWVCFFETVLHTRNNELSLAEAVSAVLIYFSFVTYTTERLQRNSIYLGDFWSYVWMKYASEKWNKLYYNLIIRNFSNFFYLRLVLSDIWRIHSFLNWNTILNK